VAGVFLLPPLFLWTEGETMKFFIDTANPGETKKAYKRRMMDGFTTKRVLGGLEEGSQEMKRGFFKRTPFNLLIQSPSN
jgi:hypothetical protein